MADIRVGNFSPGQVICYLTSMRQIARERNASNASNSSKPKGTRNFEGILLNLLGAKFTQGKRVTKKNTLEGAVIQHFLNRFSNNNDLLELSLKCSTGNIEGFITGNVDYDRARLDNLGDFYRIMEIAEEPPFISGNQSNYIQITIATPLLRSPTILYGFFKEMPTIEESGAKQKEVEFNLDFWITNRTRINYAELVQALSQAESEIQGAGN